MVNLAMAQLKVLSVLSPVKPDDSKSAVDSPAVKISSDDSSNVPESDDVARSM